MFPLICAALVILCVLGLKRLLPVSRKHRRLVRFIRKTLASSKKFGDRRVVGSLWPRMRVLKRRSDVGPATKFIPVVREELAAGRGNKFIMVVDDDRVYP